MLITVHILLELKAILDIQKLNFNDYMVRQVNLSISLSVVQINTHTV